MTKFNLLIKQGVQLTFNEIEERAISSLNCVMLTSKLAKNKTNLNTINFG